ncbi:gamma-glutamylcyclotransferase [Arsenicitalea aurantiaca]|uniref:glutathione-specific gamma-glutamylcyclotransferase n=1 Tax=Arsenicitalea aurantiaca TaxID=1783274 RepID=A0A433X5V5_9HYPH|nr:gamma-glutamylcyclotransferase [Arsenicitalea aurantiaca]RUT29431.1 gamma-glutamylcyclotransferase [Arsenicitalea aurantiaca]
MPRAPRQMRLSADHVARVPVVEDPGMPSYEGVRPATDADYAAEVDRILGLAPEGEFWLFAYGSLIWNPVMAHDREMVALARGWHRNFCLYDIRYRGNPGAPGLMLCLDRGGQCRGMAYRLPPEGLKDNLDALVRREMSMVPTPFPGRFIPIMTEEGPKRALAFAMNRRSARYVGGLTLAARADYLARATGWKGSMAEYLFATVDRLEALGIHDANLWRLQEMVAERIEDHFPHPPRV